MVVKMLSKILAILLFIAFIPTTALAQNNIPEIITDHNQNLGYATELNDHFTKDDHEKSSQCKININSLSNTSGKNTDRKIYSHSKCNSNYNKNL